MELFIGIDLGTSSVKLDLVDGKGHIHKAVSREYPVSYPRSGWSEQAPALWWEACLAGLAELLEGCQRSCVRAICCSGQMHGLVALDETDEVIRPAILWNDGRTAAEVDYLNRVVGKETLSDWTANIAFAGFTAPKLLWMRRNEPENFARIRRVMLPKDYINYRLTRVHCCDYSDASGMLLLDVAHKRWSPQMLELCALTEDRLPALYESGQVIGSLSAEAAEALGLPQSVRVVMGAGDNAAAAISTGTLGDGRCNISLGTSGTVFISSARFCMDPNNALHAFAHADGGYHLMGCMLCAASGLKWLCQDILRTDDFAAEQAAIREEELGRSHVFFLPYLMGERSPINDPLARGTFIGMTMDTTRAELVQAVPEGVAFALRDMLDVALALGIPIRRATLCGGGAKSPLWCRIISNVLNLPLDIFSAEKGPSYGSAMLAMVGCGVYKTAAECAEALVKTDRTVAPEPELAERYEERYRKFRQIYPACRELFAALAKGENEGGTAR